MNDSQPLWYVLFTALGMGFLKLLDVLKVGDLITKKTDADKECRERCVRLEHGVIKLHTTLTLVVQYLNNPENLESTKTSLESQLEGLEDIIEEINKRKSS